MNKYYESLRVQLHTEQMGNDLCITICGGDNPHIGCIAVAEPRTSLSGNGTMSATVSTFNFAGHKDDAVANTVAHKVASHLERRTVVLCGLHYDFVNQEVFSQIEKLCEQMIVDILDECLSKNSDGLL